MLDILYFPSERNMVVSYKCHVIMTTKITIESKARVLKYHYSSRITCLLFTCFLQKKKKLVRHPMT
jgi:hypothetical protein